MKKLFVLSDIHGHFTPMRTALKEAGFDPKNKEHLLVCCGDVFDRGNENGAVLRFLDGLENKVLIRGNHEDMLSLLLKEGKLLPHHYRNGTLSTLRDLFGLGAVLSPDGSVDFSGKTRTVERLEAFMGEMGDYFETKHYVFVHGWIPDHFRDASQEAWCAARKLRFTQVYDGTPPLPCKTLVCGHMPCFFANILDPDRDPDSSHIYYGDGLIAIDAGTAETGRVNVLVVEDELL